MTAVPDGTLYIVDRLRTDLGAHGGAILHATSDGVISAIATIGDSRGFVDPDDITLDSQGRVYVSDWGRNEVWRFDADGKNGVAWWTSPVVEGAKRYAPTGLAYDAQHDAILITDPEVNSIYRVPVADATKTETLYRHGDKPDAPGFDGITVTAKGDIYVVALGLNKLAKLNNGALEYLVQGFRGGSDVDSFTLPDGTVRLYVPNWDQLGLLLQAYQPHLPFAVDVITVRG
jgi:sugar lactone lactonase YvrE